MMRPSSPRVPRSLGPLLVGAALLGGATAQADGGDSIALAEALFRSGRDLMNAGKLAEACPKFAESNRIDPKLGTFLNLALCHEKAGRTASAWAEYIEAQGIAKRLGQGDRENVARDRAHELEAALVHVVIDAAPVAGEEVRLDDQPIGAGAFGTPIPVDPGDHVVTATAPGRASFRESFSVAGAAGGTRRVDVPSLEPQGAASPVPVPVVAPVDGQPSSDTRAPGSGPSRVPTVGWVVGGAGVVLVGVGAIFGVEAFSKKGTAESECNSTDCTQQGLDAISAMHTSEAISTVATGVGLAAMAAGVYLVLRSHGAADGADPRRPAATSLGVGPDFANRGLRVLATW